MKNINFISIYAIYLFLFVSKFIRITKKTKNYHIKVSISDQIFKKQVQLYYLSKYVNICHFFILCFLSILKHTKFINYLSVLILLHKIYIYFFLIKASRTEVSLKDFHCCKKLIYIILYTIKFLIYIGTLFFSEIIFNQ